MYVQWRSFVYTLFALDRFDRIGFQHPFVLIVRHENQHFNYHSTGSKYIKAILVGYKQIAVYREELRSSVGYPMFCHPNCIKGVFCLSEELLFRVQLDPKFKDIVG